MISLIITLAVIGVVLWIINVHVPMAAWIKQLINVVAAICIVFFVLRAFGVLGHDIAVPQIR